MKRKVLGRGLNALIPENLEELDGGIANIETHLISPNQHQPRTRMDEAALAELAASIRAHGVVQPIVVIRSGGGYQLVAGERRWRAAQMAGLKEIPAVVRDFSESQMLEIALIENIQREDLNPIEEARAYQKLMDHFGLLQEEVAKRVGKERSSIANALRLLRLPGLIQELIAERRLSPGHAKALLTLNAEELQLKAAEDILHQNLSVRQTEELARRLLERSPAPASAPPEDPNTEAAEGRLRRQLGTKVRIRRAGAGGRIEIDFYSEEDLHRIYSLIMSETSPHH